MNWYKQSQWGMATDTLISGPDINPKVQKLESIINTNHSEEIDGFLVDSTIAHSFISFYHKLDKDGKEKFISMPIPRMLNIVIDSSKNIN